VNRRIGSSRIVRQPSEAMVPSCRKKPGSGNADGKFVDGPLGAVSIAWSFRSGLPLQPLKWVAMVVQGGGLVAAAPTWQIFVGAGYRSLGICVVVLSRRTDFCAQAVLAAETPGKKLAASAAEARTNCLRSLKRATLFATAVSAGGAPRRMPDPDRARSSACRRNEGDRTAVLADRNAVTSERHGGKNPGDPGNSNCFGATVRLQRRRAVTSVIC